VFLALFGMQMQVFAEDSEWVNQAFKTAGAYFTNGKYREAISLYDDILDKYPNNPTALLLKAVAESNLGFHQKSLVNFYQVYEKNPKNAAALIGLGIGFGNLGEYNEAKRYFDEAYRLYPNSTVAKNYKEYADKVIKKYPYKPTPKPKNFKDFDRKSFDAYAKLVSAAAKKERRYIEYPNPSFDVIKKFLRDYEKWNFEQQVQIGASSFPDPKVTKEDGVYVLNYKIFVNQQPPGLPLDHVSTLADSTLFWEGQKFAIDMGIAKVKFSYTKSKADANIWVTWTVRKLGEGVLGHAHLGKGVVEVTLGDYYCDGSFQLYDVATIEKIMRHELGHSIGFGHFSDPANIMYPTIKQKYAYCLLS
jgi:tetratricopeptide (TPR) repeat protein